MISPPGWYSYQSGMASGPRPPSSATVTTATCTSARKASRSAGVIARDISQRLALPQCGVMDTVAVVLMVLGLIGIGSALAVLVRLRGRLARLGEQADRVARRV